MPATYTRLSVSGRCQINQFKNKWFEYPYPAIVSGRCQINQF
ncbi:hypothetical protein HMPREF0541_02713, partial [Lacticaseibacillus rhamnosus ATCC 21052]